MRTTLLKVFGMFLILYLILYILTFAAHYINTNDWETLGITSERYLLILGVLLYVPNVIFLIFIIVYLSIKGKEISFLREKENKLKKIFFSICLIYLASILLDPFYHSFRPLFEHKSVSLNGAFFIDFLSIIIIAPVFEELFARDLLLKPFLKRNIVYIGIIFTSVLYSLSHLYIYSTNYYIDYLSLTNYFFIGVILSVLRINYGLFYAILAHSFYNLLGFVYSNKIVNLFILDYIKSDYLYWSIYSFMIAFFLNFIIRQLTHSRSE